MTEKQLISGSNTKRINHGEIQLVLLVKYKVSYMLLSDWPAGQAIFDARGRIKIQNSSRYRAR